MKTLEELGHTIALREEFYDLFCVNRIIYNNKKHSKDKVYDEIHIDIYCKKYQCSRVVKKKRLPLIIDEELHNAINLKLKELGWLDE